MAKRVMNKAALWALSAVSLAAIAAPAMAEGMWISHPSVTGTEHRTDAVALQFRRDVMLDTVPASLPVAISADNRYILYINGKRVDQGPSRGDLAHWRYRTLDIAPFLKRGANVVAVQVWNDGKAAGVSQISARTGFYMDAKSAPAFDSSANWQVRIDPSRSVTPAQPTLAGTIGWDKYFAAPPPETIDASKAAAGWSMAAGSRLTDWTAAAPALAAGEGSPWHMVADQLPQQRLTPLDGGKLVLATGIRGGKFPARPITIPPNSQATLRLDMGAMRAAYPQLVTSGGKGATIDLTYAEAPYRSEEHTSELQSH